jgi:hypothetical protein
MTSREFEAALKESDNDASNLHLYELVAAGIYCDEGSPWIAVKYLRAFCSTTLSHLRRRWIGLALAAMLDASSEVVGHMESVRQQLQGLGDVILDPDEREVTKIVAGVIVRQALEQHIGFSCFWRSDKVWNSATNFPGDSGPQWMCKFQSFLDTLGKLQLANPITDPFILYPISVVGSDGLQWSSPDKGVPILIAQADFLTMLMPDEYQRDIQFLDVPIANIRGTKTQRSAPMHDSQSLSTEHEPWDLVLMLNYDTETYRLNSRQRTAASLTMMFRTSKDAQDCEVAIDALRRPRPAQAKQSHEDRPTQHMACHSSPITINRPQQPKSLPTSSDQLGKSQLDIVQSPQQSQEHSPSEDVHEGPLQPPRNTQKILIKKQGELAQSVEDVEPVRTNANISSAREMRTNGTVMAQKGMQDQKDNVHNGAARTTRTRARTESAQFSDTVAVALNDTDHTTSKQSTPSAKTYGKGKLPKLSQATKKKASQQIRKQANTPNVLGGPRWTSAKARASLEKSLDLESMLESPVTAKKFNITSRACPTVERVKKTHGKSKAEDDDDFVPNASKKTRKAATKRKAVARTTDGDKPVKKKAKTEHTASAESALSQARTQHKVGTSQRRKPKEAEMPDSSVAALRTSLIGGLLGLQNPSATKTDFKRPALPDRAPQPPSTPTHWRSLPVRSQPHTPIESRKPPKTPATSMPSSPPLYRLGDQDSVGPRTGATDTEILSSNSKATPASPHAESTAISGHADRDDVDLEKLTGEIQTARLDPFKQRREGRKQTSFTRRLTGDESQEDQQSAHKASSTSNLFHIGGTFSLDTEIILPTKAASQPLSQPRSSGSKQKSVYNNAFDSRPSTTTATLQARTMTVQERVPVETKPVEVTKVHKQLLSDNVVLPLQSSKRKADKNENRHDAPKKRFTLSVDQHSQLERPSPAPQKEASVYNDEGAAIAIDDSILAAPQQAIDETQTPRPVEAQDDLDVDGDTTLVNDDSEDALPTYKTSPINFNFRSSPPMPGTPSSHSSTSKEQESSPRSPLPTSQAEEEEWEATLQPHQRALHDMLMRVSKRVLRNVVDNETAVTDIADVYANDGEHLVNELLQRQDGECKELWDDMSCNKTTLKKEMTESLKALARERKRISALP